MVQKEQFVSKKKQSILVLGEQLWVGGYLRLLVGYWCVDSRRSRHYLIVCKPGCANYLTLLLPPLISQYLSLAHCHLT